MKTTQEVAIAPHLPDFRIVIKPGLMKSCTMSTQTVIRLDEVEDPDAPREYTGEGFEEPLIVQGFFEAMHRTRAGQEFIRGGEEARQFPDILPTTHNEETGHMLIKAVLRNLAQNDPAWTSTKQWHDEDEDEGD